MKLRHLELDHSIRKPLIFIKKTSFPASCIPLLNNWILQIKAHHSAGPLGQDGEGETPSSPSLPVQAMFQQNSICQRVIAQL